MIRSGGAVSTDVTGADAVELAIVVAMEFEVGCSLVVLGRLASGELDSDGGRCSFVAS